MSSDNKQSLRGLTLAAIGVVYGDIGTSPLYTLRECLSGQFGFGVEREAVFGFLSLIFWLLVLVVSLKYISYVMRADNAGEGGILTLMSLAGRHTGARATAVLVIMGLIGGSFFYGEVVITPAISVMSAIEGLEIAAPSLDPFIVPMSIAVLTLLFAIQKPAVGEGGQQPLGDGLVPAELGREVGHPPLLPVVGEGQQHLEDPVGGLERSSSIGSHTSTLSVVESPSRI